jgi:hypothetical protein
MPDLDQLLDFARRYTDEAEYDRQLEHGVT